MSEAKKTSLKAQKAEEAKKENNQSQSKEAEFKKFYDKYVELTKKEPAIEWDLEKLKEEVLKLQGVNEPIQTNEGQEGSSTEEPKEEQPGEGEEGPGEDKGSEEGVQDTLKGAEGSEEDNSQTQTVPTTTVEEKPKGEAKKDNKPPKTQNKKDEKKSSPLDAKYQDLMNKYSEDIVSGKYVVVLNKSIQDLLLVPAMVFKNGAKKDSNFVEYVKALD